MLLGKSVHSADERRQMRPVLLRQRGKFHAQAAAARRVLHDRLGANLPFLHEEMQFQF